MQDEEAKQFFAVADGVSASSAKLAVLENVPGIARVMDSILARLRQCGRYKVIVLTIDPAQLGTDVSRPRVFFLMLHASVLDGESTAMLEGKVKTLHSKLQQHFQTRAGAKRKWETLLFDESSAPVQKWRKVRDT